MTRDDLKGKEALFFKIKIERETKILRRWLKLIELRGVFLR